MSAIDTSQLLDALSEQQRERAGFSTKTLNLVAFVEEAAMLERLMNRLETFTRKHPMRAIVLDASRSDEREVRAACTENGDKAPTQSEEIVLGVSSLPPREIRSVVHDLLVPDVTCALFWAGRELEDERFSELISLSNSVVVDSSRAGETGEALHGLAQLSTTTDRYLSDLSYLRLLNWQDMIAEFFDDPELVNELPAIASVEIVCGSEPEAYYLAGWLASRLEWKPCGKHELCNSAGQTIEVSIEKRGDPRRVQSVVLRSAHCSFNAELDRDTPDLVCLTVTGTPSREKRCAPLHDIDLVSLVEQAMLVPRKDAVFAGALQMARAIFDTGT